MPAWKAESILTGDVGSSPTPSANNKNNNGYIMSHYIDKAEFYDDIVKYNRTGVISNSLAEKFTILALHIKDSHSFRRYEIDDMVEDAICECVVRLPKFDISHPSKNPFHYFSQRIIWSYIASINKLKKRLEVEGYLHNVQEYMRGMYPFLKVWH